MVNTSTNVVVAAPITGGGALVAPTGTALPTTASSTLNVAFTALGYLSDDGITEITNRSTDKQYGWGGDTIATTQKSYAKQFKLTIAEYLNATAKQVVKGATNVTVTAATASTNTLVTSKDTAAILPVQTWVFEIISGAAKIRKVIPNARVVDIGDIAFKSTDISGTQITLDAYPDASGVYMYEYTDDGVHS